MIKNTQSTTIARFVILFITILYFIFDRKFTIFVLLFTYIDNTVLIDKAVSPNVAFYYF